MHTLRGLLAARICSDQWKPDLARGDISHELVVAEMREIIADDGADRDKDLRIVTRHEAEGGLGL